MAKKIKRDEKSKRFAQQNLERLKFIKTKINKVIENAQNLKKSSPGEEKLLNGMMNTYLVFRHSL